MRVLLIIPTHQYKFTYPTFLSLTDFPTGFAYLAAALKSAGNEIYGLNLNNILGYQSAYEMISTEIRHKLREIEPELICLGGLCTDFTFLKDAMHIIRRLAPHIPIVCGGGIVTYDAEFIFKTLRPDFCIIGEGEEILVELVNTLKRSSYDYDRIANLGYWKDGRPVFTRQDFNYGDINLRKIPDYEPFGIDEMLDIFSIAARPLYRYTQQNPRPMSIVTARSCPFNCTFCVHQQGLPYRARTVDNIMQEIAVLYERYHFNILIILDELFAVNKQRLKEFCLSLLEARRTKKWDFDWLFQTHPSASLDVETLTLAKKAGCYFFSYGLESASPRVLKSMNKRSSVSKITEAIPIANEVGVGFGGNFIFGDVAETEETICETLDFFKRYCQDIHITLGSIQPYPGSQIFQHCLQCGIIRDKLEFYETIDEDVWNMTSMSDGVWFPWICLLIFFALSSPWVKTTDVEWYEDELQTAEHPMVVYSQKLICKIRVRCPYCGNITYYREIAKNFKGGQGKDIPCVGSKSFLLKIKSLFPRKRIRIVLRLFLKSPLWYFLHFRHRRMFKALKETMADKAGEGRFFVTGCPHCNKMIKVRLPVKDARSKLGFMFKQLLLNVI